MSRWINGQIVGWSDIPLLGSPGWVKRDCGCCNGISWGGSEPVECSDCRGVGAIAVHLASGTLAEYPGGPLLGRLAAQNWHPDTQTTDKGNQ